MLIFVNALYKSPLLLLLFVFLSVSVCLTVFVVSQLSQSLLNRTSCPPDDLIDDGAVSQIVPHLETSPGGQFHHPKRFPLGVMSCQNDGQGAFWGRGGRDGERRTQKLKSHLVRTQSLNAEIKVPSGENTELKRSPFKAWSRSVYSHTCYAYFQGFLPYLFIPFRSIPLHFFPKPLPIFSCVGFG